MDADTNGDQAFATGVVSSQKNMKRVVHQFHYWASPGDAITNQMRFLRKTLQEAGYDAKIFARSIKGNLKDEVIPFDGKAIEDADLLLLHHSQGTPELESILRLKSPRALVYHNITPSHFFSHDPVVAKLCELGRAQLRTLVKSCRYFFADSQFNASELKALGASEVTQLPLFELSKGESPPLPAKAGKASRLLFVGRLCPHKDQERLIETMYYLVHDLKSPATLTLVGGGDRLYRLYLQSLIRARGLESQVQIRSDVSDAELKQIYQESDLFLCVSRHEGFCIPLIEAMRYGLPVFSTTDTALGETLGGAGVQLQTRDPQKLAPLLAASLGDPLILDAVRCSGRVRFQEMQAFQNREEALKRIQAVVGETS